MSEPLTPGVADIEKAEGDAPGEHPMLEVDHLVKHFPITRGIIFELSLIHI